MTVSIRKICVFTGTRAEYGLLKPLMIEIDKEPELILKLVASGMHLSSEFGLTYKLIEADGFQIDQKIEMLLSSDSPVGIAKALGLGIIGYIEALDRLKPDIVVILGDRFEGLAMAQACMIGRVPIAHLHGGESTYGVIDEAIRHSISKMSHLHFTSTDEYRRRVIQLGEDPKRVFNVGAIGIENIRKLALLSRHELEKDIGFGLSDRYFLVTYHPVTLEHATSEKQFRELLNALDEVTSDPSHGTKIIFTKANADTEGRIINRSIDDYVDIHRDKAIAFTSMGQVRYLSAMKHASAVVGNSSSGIVESPSFKVPAVNIGDRQKGRIQANNVINCEPVFQDILRALTKVASPDFRKAVRNAVNPYEKEGTVNSILEVLKGAEIDNIIRKPFFDISFECP